MNAINDILSYFRSANLYPAITGNNLLADIGNIIRKAGGLIGGALPESIGGVSTEMFGDFKELMELQLQVQMEMQTISMVSNIEKSKHESKMAAIRNIRAN